MYKEKHLTFNEFRRRFEAIEGSPLCHMDLYYKKIDLHWGEYQQSDSSKYGDVVLYVSGSWEIIDSEHVILNEENTSEEISLFFKGLVGHTLVSTKLFQDSNEIFFEFSNKLYLHVEADGNRWVELVKRDGSNVHLKNNLFVESD